MNLGKDAQNVQKITDLIKENPRTTLLELEQDTGISKTTIGRIVTKDLKLKRTPAKFIPRFLTNEQKLCRLATCENMLEMTRTDPEWKDKIITGDETWVYDYDPETKRQYAEWRGQGEPRPKKSRILKSRNKVLLVAFLDNKGIVHHEYLPAGQTGQSCIVNCGDDCQVQRSYKSPCGPLELDLKLVNVGVLELVREDRRITVREVAEEAGISFGSTQSIMKDILGVRRLNTVLVPEDLTFDQKNARKETASLNLEATTDDPELLKRVITGDDTWIYGFDSETTQQASDKVKVMSTVFFDYQGIVHHEFQQQGSTITADSYLGVLRRLRKAIRQKRPELWGSKSWILHHDNAQAQTAHNISKFLQDHLTSVFSQSPYSPDLAPCDFFLFGKLKKSYRVGNIRE
ncbi:hypothetical protein LAZ67_18001359 [Cordylochernes scorpioides]|uniref:Transposase n=1 Tax=Cordylochernes scorpioides TaxID=51811 RepID=A0ABY6LKG8_9ARAC|nr:hypothetical protein LAZ67_18001359 [Cordylochernes scorpioides]